MFGPFGPGGPDGAFTVTVMTACRTALGARCVLDNHALSAPLRAVDQPIYDAIGTMQGPINFQTEAPQTMGCLWTQTIAQGVALGAVGIEVWPAAKFQGLDSLALADVTTLASEFTSPIPVGTPTPLPMPCSGFH